MKGVSNRITGISLIEIMIALAIGTILLVTIYESLRQIEVGLIWSRWRLEAEVVLTNELRTLRHYGFYATSTPTYFSRGQAVSDDDCNNKSCLRLTQSIQSDTTCGQQRIQKASFQLQSNTPKRVLRVSSYLLDSDDLLLRGGDCTWLYQNNTSGSFNEEPSALGGNFDSLDMDAFNQLLVIVGSTSPQFRVYEAAQSKPVTYILKNASVGDGRRINAVDVVRDHTSGRLFAYVVFHDRVNQFGVFELFDDEQEPILLTTRTFGGVNSLGSFPQGWRVVVYGDRVFVLTRETAGTELQIFSITDPTSPTEIVSARTELSRTVNDFDVIRVTENGLSKEYLFLAASAALKEFAVFDVTSAVPVEILALNLPGTSNAEALYVTTTHVYLGRQTVGAGPELYQYAINDLIHGSTTPRAIYEVGVGVTNISAVGGDLYVTTSRSPSDLDRYSRDETLWQTNNARLSRVSVAGLLPHTSDRIDTGLVLLRRVSGEESIISLTQP